MIFFCLLSVSLAGRFVPEFEYFGTVWPQPQSIRQEDTFNVLAHNVDIVYAPDTLQCAILQDVFNRYGKIIRSGLTEENSKKLRFGNEEKIETIQVHVYNCEEMPKDGMNEAYTLTVHNGEVRIMAEAEWGVIHPLETFAQLVKKNENYSGVRTTFITDFPRFSFRGLLIDTSRHFLPISVIKAMITAMSWNKLNVLHWHIVDLDSFPYQSLILPNLSGFGSYSKFNHVYSLDDIKDIVEFARFRGIRVIPEFDTPGHTESWGPGAGQGFLTSCCDDSGRATGTYGPVDPTRLENYEILAKLFYEIKSVFPDGYLHLGGDEVPFSCWKSNPNITRFMEENNLESYAQLESVWVQGIIEIAQKLDFNYVVWEEVFNNGVQINEKTVVEVWKGRLDESWKKVLKKVTASNHKAILAAPWYLNIIRYGVDWQNYYEVEPTDFDGTEKQKKLVMGGSAAMWGEYVDGTNILSRTWPRASAVAERLWSAKDVRSVADALPRLNEWRCRMIERGLPAEPSHAVVNKPSLHKYGYCPTPFDPFNSKFLF